MPNMVCMLWTQHLSASHQTQLAHC